jgi:hypothetical protein
MTRKIKKQKRKRSLALNLSVELMKEIGKKMAQLPRRKNENKKHYCVDGCGLLFCVGFDGIDLYCHECFYFRGCLKEEVIKKTCLHCGGER